MRKKKKSDLRRADITGNSVDDELKLTASFFSQDGSSVSTVSTPDGIRTVTVIPTAGDGSQGAGNEPVKEKGPSSGKIAGIVIGVVLGIAALVAIGWFIIRRRRANEQGGGTFENRSSHSSAFAGWGSDAREKDPPSASSGVMAGGAAGDRNSRLMPVDPRMDPFTSARTKSRESVNTLHDDQDYSRRVHQPRVLRAMNPDPVEE